MGLRRTAKKQDKPISSIVVNENGRQKQYKVGDSWPAMRPAQVVIAAITCDQGRYTIHLKGQVSAISTFDVTRVEE